MKTTNEKKNQMKGLRSRSEQSTTEETPKIDFARRRANRELGTEAVLALLRDNAPEFYGKAEVVGSWVWVQFDENQPREITTVLSQLGFHWNNRRQVWQHPCGQVRDEPSPRDPRRKYESYFPATRNAA